MANKTWNKTGKEVKKEGKGIGGKAFTRLDKIDLIGESFERKSAVSSKARKKKRKYNISHN